MSERVVPAVPILFPPKNNKNAAPSSPPMCLYPETQAQRVRPIISHNVVKQPPDVQNTQKKKRGRQHQRRGVVGSGRSRPAAELEGREICRAAVTAAPEASSSHCRG